jgi:glycosyltransferase involved in cell wall biosynthesis
MFDVSVIICSNNPQPDSIAQVLRSLQAQTLSTSKWELLVVDNASIEPLKKLYDISWHPAGRHVVEPKHGLSVARCRAILESRGNFLVFVDDDNVLDADYLSCALTIGLTWPNLGVWGSGQTTALFEAQPAEHLLPFIEYLAIRNMRRTNWTNTLPCNDATPWGAGMVLRRDVADAYREMCNNSNILISGRRGTTLLAGDDMEISYVACDMGYGVGTFPELKLSHLLPKRRVEEKYLLKIVEGSKIADFLLAYKWRKIDRVKYRLGPLNSSFFKRLIIYCKLQVKLILLQHRAWKVSRRMIDDFEGKS